MLGTHKTMFIQPYDSFLNNKNVYGFINIYIFADLYIFKYNSECLFNIKLISQKLQEVEISIKN